MSKLEFIINEIVNDTNYKKFAYFKQEQNFIENNNNDIDMEMDMNNDYNNDLKINKITELKAHLLLLGLIRFFYINKCNLSYMNELRHYIYSYGLNIDLKTCDAFSAPISSNIPFNINKEKILKFVRLCDFESLVKIFENLFSSLIKYNDSENDYMNEHVELGQISNMLKDFFDFYRKIISDKITLPRNHLNTIRGKIKDVK
jgi:hypothetical protein